MKKHLTAALAATLFCGAAGVALAQPHWDRDHHDRGRHEGWDRGRHEGWRHDRYNQGWDYNRHWRPDWRRGARMDWRDWRRAQRLDWRRHHLRRPPYGYEWREVDGNYVLAAVATGLIADLIMNKSY
jgi:Ni/Co efflux regulator RcnB